MSGCDTSQCGACVVHAERPGRQVVHGARGVVRRRERHHDRGALRPKAGLHPMQEAFREHHALQCGFCTPGMIMAALDIVARKGHRLDEATIRDELEGNLCRCTGYHNIVKAIAAGASSDERAPRGCRVAGGTGDEQYRYRPIRAPRRGLPLHHRQRPVHRRHRSSRPVLRRVRALAARACHDQGDRHRARPRQRRASSASSPGSSSSPTRSAG